MAKIDKDIIQKLRTRTGCGLLDCRKALEEAGGDLDKAVEFLRKKGAAVAAKRAEKETAQGLVHSYIHPGAQLGVMVEINCETDFVARTEDIKQFAQDLCLQIAAMRPLYLNPEEVDPKLIQHEKDVFKEQLADSGKPEKVLNQIIEGKIKKLYSDICLLNQTYVKNDQKTITDVLNELVAKTGENVKIRRFALYEIGG